MSEENQQINGAAVQADPEADAIKERVQFLMACGSNQQQTHALLGLTDMESAEVSMQTLINAFLHGFEGNVREAMNALEGYANETLAKIRHDEACKIVLPAGVGRH